MFIFFLIILYPKFFFLLLKTFSKALNSVLEYFHFNLNSIITITTATTTTIIISPMSACGCRVAVQLRTWPVPCTYLVWEFVKYSFMCSMSWARTSVEANPSPDNMKAPIGHRHLLIYSIWRTIYPGHWLQSLGSLLSNNTMSSQHWLCT